MAFHAKIRNYLPALVAFPDHSLSAEARHVHPTRGKGQPTAASMAPYAPKRVGAGGAVSVVVGNSNPPDAETGKRTGPVAYAKVRKTEQDELKDVLEEVYELTLDPRYNRLILGNLWPLTVWYPEAALQLAESGGLQAYELSQQSEKEAMDALVRHRGGGYISELTGVSAERIKRISVDHVDRLKAHIQEETAGMTEEDHEVYKEFMDKLARQADRAEMLDSDKDMGDYVEEQRRRVARWIYEEKEVLEGIDWTREGRQRAQRREEREPGWYEEKALALGVRGDYDGEDDDDDDDDEVEEEEVDDKLTWGV